MKQNLREIQITKVNLQELNSARNGQISKDRAKLINQDIVRYLETNYFQVGKTIKLYTSKGWYNGKIGIKRLGIYYVPYKNTPVYAVITLSKEGVISVEISRRSGSAIDII